ncbi:MAG: methionine sulfoxide reductase, partial [Chlamydiae bacterium]|nr:methionine sulfoxide reductase [Chlamydiota bacterium]
MKRFHTLSVQESQIIENKYTEKPGTGAYEHETRE